MIWYGVACRYALVWNGMPYDVMWHDMTWHMTHDTLRVTYDTRCMIHDMWHVTCHVLMWHMTWHGMLWHDMTWYVCVYIYIYIYRHYIIIMCIYIYIYIYTCAEEIPTRPRWPAPQCSGVTGREAPFPATWKHSWNKHGFSRIPSNSHMVIINMFAICYLRVFWK